MLMTSASRRLRGKKSEREVRRPVEEKGEEEGDGDDVLDVLEDEVEVRVAYGREVGVSRMHRGETPERERARRLEKVRATVRPRPAAALLAARTVKRK